MSPALNTLDWAVMAVYFIAVGALGWYLGRRERGTEDFFLAGRNMPWWMVCVSLMATEISAATFVGVPEAGYNGNYQYLQFAFGSLIGRYLIAYILLPAFFRERIDTIYGYLKARFGSLSHILSSVFFFTTRILASGVRLYVASLALMVALQVSLPFALGLVVMITLFYTSTGGLKAVMGTDMIQFVVFSGGALLALATLLASVPGGLEGILQAVSLHEAETGFDKMKVFNPILDFSDPETLIVSVLFGCFMTFAAIGADQDLAQRLLSCEKVRESQRAILITGYVTFPVVILFLFIGTALFAFFEAFPAYPLPESTAQIFPHFIVHHLPHGLVGLLVVGLIASAMSSLDSTMNALASSAVLDIYKPYLRPHATEREYLWLSRVMIFVFGFFLVGLAWLCAGHDNVLYLGFRLVSFTYGALLGIFCLGALTRRGSDRGNAIAMFTSVALVAGIHFLQQYLVNTGIWSRAYVAWSWYIVIGTLSTFLIGACFRPSRDRLPKPIMMP